MKILYFDCFSGISGDMALAALVDAGASLQRIEKEIKKLPIESFIFHSKKVLKKEVNALKIDVILDPDSSITHHRYYTDIIQMINESALPEKVKIKAKKIFEKIAVAEAKVHQIPLEKVHFREAGAVDSIVDIIGVSLALEELRIEQIYTSPIPLGAGQIKIAQGIYPVPTPATLEILKGIPIRSSRVQSEMTTPTGAGIVAALGSGFQGYPSMTVHAIGYGAGSKDFDDRPNVLRAVIGTIHELYITEPQFHIHEHQNHHQEHHHDHHRPQASSK